MPLLPTIGGKKHYVLGMLSVRLSFHPLTPILHNATSLCLVEGFH